MAVTLLGIVTEVSEAQLAKAESPMATVGYPLKVDGIVIDPPAPVYPVIVATLGLPLIV